MIGSDSQALQVNEGGYTYVKRTRLLCTRTLPELTSVYSSPVIAAIHFVLFFLASKGTCFGFVIGMETLAGLQFCVETVKPSRRQAYAYGHVVFDCKT